MWAHGSPLDELWASETVSVLGVWKVSESGDEYLVSSKVQLLVSEKDERWV